MEEFQVWLTNKLLSLESDDSVITDYINGILTGDESQSEKEEALEGILCGIMESGVEDFCREIFAKWNQCDTESAVNVEDGATPKVGIEDQLSKIMIQQNLSATVTEKPKVSNTDKKLKEAILKQYAEISDEEDEDEDEEHIEAGKNTNREDVSKEEQERRERMKAESAAKREKDKLDREKQKQQQTDRKDKEKKRTAKTEKRR